MVGSGPIVGMGGSVGCTMTIEFCFGVSGWVIISGWLLLYELDGLHADKNSINKNDSVR
jgi:hypothetical protein